MTNPKLPPADPWDRQTGVKHVADFEVDCFWEPVNNEWALVKTYINLHDGTYSLSKDVEVLRVKTQSRVRDELFEAPVLSALAWTKRALGSGGVTVLGMHERNPGHVVLEQHDSAHFRWYASVGSRLSVAVVRLDGNLEGHARLVPVE